MEKEFLEAMRQIVREEISGVKSDVSSLKDDVSSLKDDVSSLKDDVSSLKSQVSENTKLLRALEHKTDVNTAKLEQLSHDVAELKGTKKKVDKLETSLKQHKHKINIIAEEANLNEI